MRVQRFDNNPIIRPHMDDRMGDNINGPSLIRVPEWVSNPLGRYYLYFAHHEGTYIRLAYADDLHGPWQIQGSGVLDLADAYFDHHIASPDVHVLDDTQEIRMYFHGCCVPEPPHQVTRCAVSQDGLHFTVRPEVLGWSYWRAFYRDHYWYTLEMPGVFRRSRDGLTDFEQGPTLFNEHMRHSAVMQCGDTLYVFYSVAHDCPERILWTTIRLHDDWMQWRPAESQTLLAPEYEYEGVDCALEPSMRGLARTRVHQLRDPCIYQEAGLTYLLYTVAGEHGIAIGQLLCD